MDGRKSTNWSKKRGQLEGSECKELAASVSFNVWLSNGFQKRAASQHAPKLMHRTQFGTSCLRERELFSDVGPIRHRLVPRYFRTHRTVTCLRTSCTLCLSSDAVLPTRTSIEMSIWWQGSCGRWHMWRPRAASRFDTDRSPPSRRMSLVRYRVRDLQIQAHSRTTGERLVFREFQAIRDSSVVSP